MSAAAENKYQALAKQRQAAALAGRAFQPTIRSVRANAKRLLKWKRVHHKCAERAIGWAERAVREHCR